MKLSGWDTVTALSVESVNRILAERELIGDFSFAGDTFGTPYRGSGTLSAWRILPGDTGDLLRLALPIATGTVQAGSGRAIDLAGLTAVVTVSLELLPSDLSSGPGNLVFSLRKAAKTGDSPVPGVVTPVALTGPAATLAELGDLGQRTVLDGIAGSLADRASALSFVLAQVNLVPPGTGDPLAPVQAAYIYVRTRDAGYVAVLGVTDTRDIARLPRTIEPELLADGREVVFGMSPELFLTAVVRPGLPQVFGGDASIADMVYDPAWGAIRNTSAFSIRSLKEGAIWYTPRVTFLSVSVIGGDLAVRVEGDCDLKAGISMTYWVTSQSRMVFDPASATISFTTDRDPKSGSEADIPLWFILGGILVEGITQLVVTIVSDDIAAALGSRGGITGLDQWGNRSVRWCGSRATVVERAALDECFFISGRLA
ncbi:TULIP family P47-like protein [Planotetraspora sp. A-T 1434]|uniref:TULIP family P47-like protein n=1 Tax=Planotetraspora sp. A-T 1434 TaxID=2979219 RepID=UPI0021C08347|nr:TULIP family P47-like protein [Planotetraspora sp. A-T 1434]MCT9932152.1 TULIP family P47-like protein [Planotetraspora sp. A-T 1434]